MRAHYLASPTPLPAAAVAFALFGDTAFAQMGGKLLPVEGHIDLAEKIVLGTVIDIKPLEETSGSPRLGMATVWVREMLKGEAADEERFKVVLWHSEHAAIHLPAVQVGDDGIWLVMSGGEAAHTAVLIPESMADRMRRYLAMLRDRRWSEPVGGLRAWAVSLDRPWGVGQIVLFAVKNCTDEAIYYPRAHASRAAYVEIEGDEGEKRRVFLTDRGLAHETRAICFDLQPDKIAYVPYYGYIDPGGKLPPGHYAVTVGMRNEKEGYMPQRKGVPAWKGEVRAPPVTLEVVDRWVHEGHPPRKCRRRSSCEPWTVSPRRLRERARRRSPAPLGAKAQGEGP